MEQRNITIGLLAVAIAPNLFMHWYNKGDAQSVDLATTKIKIEKAVEEIRDIRADVKGLREGLAEVTAGNIQTRAQLIALEQAAERRGDDMTRAINGLANAVERASLASADEEKELKRYAKF